MKKLFLIAVFIILSTFSFAHAQKVEVDQSFIDDATKAFELVVEQRDAIKKLINERKLSVVERQSAEILLKGLNDLLLLKNKTIEQYQEMVRIQQTVIEFQLKIIEKLQQMINKPKSMLDKVLKILKEVSLIFGGIILGRGL